MEDLDPEIAVNPVVAAKLELERQRRDASRKGKHKASTAPGAPGAFARLGISVDDHKKGPTKPPEQRYLASVDRMLAAAADPGGGAKGSADVASIKGSQVNHVLKGAGKSLAKK